MTFVGVANMSAGLVIVAMQYANLDTSSFLEVMVALYQNIS